MQTAVRSLQCMENNITHGIRQSYQLKHQFTFRKLIY